MFSYQSPQEQFDQIYHTYHRDVYHFLFCFTGNRGDAEDLMQETFIRVVKSLEKFKGHSQLKTWILAIAKNAAREWARKKKFSHIFSEAFLKSVPTNEGLPETQMLDKEDYQRILAALQTLKPQYRTVVILRLFEEYSVKETAEILACSETKVKVDYHRAIKKMQDELEPSMEGEWANGWAK
ncbi:RNA polymerase sigma factor [Brevibacillus fluminis]|uniref:RNA polymerase sigma factor n=1 Tax=Brevibacillus fluminis TaxID=511487 RepID=UPI003F89E161